MTGLPSNFGGPGMKMSEYYNDDEEEDEEMANQNKNNRVAFHGNEKTMNMNPLILANVTNSPYFKVDLFAMKTFHEVVDEIYYKVDHLEPWERGTRKTAGMSQTGMCGGVRGVSAGGVVSSAFCLLFKLHCIKLTKKQAYALLNHCDSPYIRALGFMYLRFTLPPAEMWHWFEPYIDDQEEIDIKAGGGKPMTMGEFCRMILTRLEWFETRFPRIAVTAEKQIRAALDERFKAQRVQQVEDRKSRGESERRMDDRGSRGGSERIDDRKSRDRSSRDRSERSQSKREKSKSVEKVKKRSRSRSRDKRSKDRKRSRSKEKKRSRSRSREKKSKKDKKHKRSRSRSRDKKRRSRDRSRSRGRRGNSYEDELRKYKELKKSRKSRSRSKDRR
ncbi:pre-mRNA-splicing factor 38B [Eurytemora carolleeae]|uniref:pre-mRNA-splicing factor 38B n=1 Tax=Eurytemora carolleeae TaxID=1294199 RepID=UPI000C76F3F1|nr:pre-mRNA-splicing factor 38B [Eurytemora carolleeae]|eukprot:XP_023349552.1 pre-mRNA-splicing factor 38B-like [Eurytemora affinis]